MKNLEVISNTIGTIGEEVKSMTEETIDICGDNLEDCFPCFINRIFEHDGSNYSMAVEIKVKKLD